jgi:hypothetical protein
MNQEEELQLPLIFEQCPNCQSTRRIGQALLKTKGIVQPLQAGVEQKQALMAIPLPPTQVSPLVTPEIPVVIMDACQDCGTLYVVAVQKVKGQMQIRPGGPGDQGRGPIQPFSPQ